MPEAVGAHIMTVGNGGRESAFARALSEDGTVSAVLAHANPSIVRRVRESGGSHYLGDVNDADFVCRCARDAGADYVFVNADQPLATGVVDALLAAGINAIGPTRDGARIEWDKVYATELMGRLFPANVARYRVVNSTTSCAEALAEFRRDKLAVVVKPKGLTGGKGVKVMGEHFADYGGAADYVGDLLARGEPEVLLSERCEGREFTIMGISDGRDIVFAPPSYDYPYRYEGDSGPGTGGMGCLTFANHCLPFVDDASHDHCREIMRAVIDHFHTEGIHFNGVLNGGFFATASGIRFMEFNSRFGDPEAINVLSVLDSSFSELLVALCEQKLAQHPPTFAHQASVVKYLVSPEYPSKPQNPDAAPLEFDMRIDLAEADGVAVDCASMVATDTPGRYRALAGSRVVAFSATADEVPVAAARVNDAIERYGTEALEYRRDIASSEEVQRLAVPP